MCDMWEVPEGVEATVAAKNERKGEQDAGPHHGPPQRLKVKGRVGQQRPCDAKDATAGADHRNAGLLQDR